MNTKICYIPRESALFCNPQTVQWDYLYTDGITSGAALIAVGEDTDGQPLAAIAHLSTEIRFRSFFRQVESRFRDGYAFYACGANPPQPVEHFAGMPCFDALMTADIITQWVSGALYFPGKTLLPPDNYISCCTLSLGAGEPQQFGACGISVDPHTAEYLQASTQPVVLTAEQRDPAGGLCTLSALYGIKTRLPSLLLHAADRAFDQEEADALVWEARRSRLTTVLTLTDEQLLEQYSAMPQYEPEWFCDMLRRAAELVEDYGDIAENVGRQRIEF